ncbi:MAG: helix-turn-helix domain-containing protein, partial [Nitrosomonas ureae]
LLGEYRWPGNVRELENAMQRVLILTQGEEVSAETIRLCLPHWKPEAATAAAAPAISAAMSADVLAAPAVSRPLAAVAPPSATAERPANMKDLEREHILATLREFAGSRRKTVEKLGISERTLRYKLQQYREEGYDV